MTHTPTPWVVENLGHYTPEGSQVGAFNADGKRRLSVRIASRRPMTDAEFIVRAVNSHDDLLAALEGYMSQFGQALEAHGIPFGPAQQAADAAARAAIAKARGQQ